MQDNQFNGLEIHDKSVYIRIFSLVKSRKDTFAIKRISQVPLQEVITKISGEKRWQPAPYDLGPNSTSGLYCYSRWTHLFSQCCCPPVPKMFKKLEISKARGRGRSDGRANLAPDHYKHPLASTDVLHTCSSIHTVVYFY